MQYCASCGNSLKCTEERLRKWSCPKPHWHPASHTIIKPVRILPTAETPSKVRSSAQGFTFLDRITKGVFTWPRCQTLLLTLSSPGAESSSSTVLPLAEKRPQSLSLKKRIKAYASGRLYSSTDPWGFPFCQISWEKEGTWRHSVVCRGQLWLWML